MIAILLRLVQHIKISALRSLADIFFCMHRSWIHIHSHIQLERSGHLRPITSGPLGGDWGPMTSGPTFPVNQTTHATFASAREYEGCLRWQFSQLKTSRTSNLEMWWGFCFLLSRRPTIIHCDDGWQLKWLSNSLNWGVRKKETIGLSAPNLNSGQMADAVVVFPAYVFASYRRLICYQRLLCLNVYTLAKLHKIKKMPESSTLLTIVPAPKYHLNPKHFKCRVSSNGKLSRDYLT